MTSCQSVWHTRIVLRNVAVVVVNGFLPFEFGTICEVFGVDRADDRLPPYELSVVAGELPPVRAHNDFTINPSCGLDRLEDADLIALPAVDDERLGIYAGKPVVGPHVPPPRDGGQAQYVDQPVAPSCDGALRDLLEWLRAHLDQPLSVRQLAARANMSERTFARRFVQDTGTTPQRWLIGQRILLAQQLLDESDETVDA